ncbi:MAG: hypothetical protein ABIF77_16915 [bacterium]
MFTSSFRSGLVGLLAVALFSAGLQAATFVEDFSSTEYCDQLATTAWWDTGAGDIKLFPFEISMTGNYDTPGTARDLVIAGDYAFIADDGSGLQILDITDPANPGFLGSFDTSGRAFGVAIAGDHAYVADYGSGLVVLDISDPTNPIYAGGWDMPGDMFRNVAVVGDYAYMADRSSGLQIMYISDPTNPVPAGNYNTSGWAYDVVIGGDCAFVADLSSGLQVIDISDPLNPFLLGSLDTPGSARGLTVVGDYAYMADGGSGLQVIDISDPANPFAAGSCGIAGDAQTIAISGDYLYMAAYDGGFSVLDISDPTNPILLDVFDTPGLAMKVAIAGDQAYLADGEGGLQVVRVADPVLPPRRVGSLEASGLGDLIVVGDHIFSVGYEGLQVIDISDLRRPEIVWNNGFPYVYDLVASGDYAYLSGANYGLLILDISDPVNPVYLGNCETPGSGLAVAITDRYAFIADDEDFGVEVIDFADPTNPVNVGSYYEPGGCWPKDVAIAGDRAYIAGYATDLVVLDISDPTNPAYLGSSDVTPGASRRLAVAGDHAYLVDSWGLHVVDISDPTNLTLLGTYDPVGMSINFFKIAGDYAYLGGPNSSLLVVDISNPTNPVLVGTYNSSSGGNIYTFALAGDYLFARCGSGLDIVQALWRQFDPARPVGQSLAIDATDDSISRVRLAAAQTDSVQWEMSANGGVDWQELLPDFTWQRMAAVGSDLRWRSTHVHESPGVNPSCSELTIGWLFDCPTIDDVVDIPADQGGQVRIGFSRSGRDFADEMDLPIDDYCLWRRVDDRSVRKNLDILRDTQGPAAGSEVFDSYLRPLGDRIFMIGGQGEALGQFPLGVWEAVGSFSATQQDHYLTPVTTLTDSSGAGIPWSVFCVTAHTTTPSIWYCSPPDSGYSVDNIAPAIPGGFMMGENSVLIWDASLEPDFQYYTVYGSAVDHFDETAVLVDYTIETSLDVSGQTYSFFLLTASDYAGNESDAAAVDALSAVPDAEPLNFTLHQCAPNPFNPSTTITFDLPMPSRVDLWIFDLSGRLVRMLMSDVSVGAGRSQVVWDGNDDTGRSAASSTYFYRLTAGPHTETKRMALVR